MSNACKKLVVFSFAALRKSGRASLDRTAEGGCPHMNILAAGDRNQTVSIVASSTSMMGMSSFTA